VYKFVLAAHLRANEPGRERLIRVARDARDPAVFDMHEERAHVGTVVRAHGPNDGLHASTLPAGGCVTYLTEGAAGGQYS
jgi:hypothetical protein